MNIPQIHHKGLNIFVFIGSINLNLSRATCFSDLLDLLLYNRCIQLRKVSRKVSLMPVNILWVQILDILPINPASSIILCSSWIVVSLVWRDLIWIKQVTHDHLLHGFKLSLSSICRGTSITSGRVAITVTGADWVRHCTTSLCTISRCWCHWQLQFICWTNTPLTSQMWQRDLPPGPTWHANSLCIGLSLSRVATNRITRTWSSRTQSQAQIPMSHAAL